jgi:hypothetical protein
MAPGISQALQIYCGLLGLWRRFSESVETAYKTTRCHNPEDHNWHPHRRQNPESQTVNVKV